jgi:hypothetical protein
MAYRFLLEVPETLADAASIAVEQVGDTQVLLVRPSHGLGVDDPYLDLSVAAHSLRAVDAIYDWYEGLGPTRPPVRIVLHGGQRHALAAVDRATVVALIRRDQPWVERSIPHVGEHEAPVPAGYSVGPGVPPGDAELERLAGGAVAVAERAAADELLPTGEPARRLRVRAVNYIQMQVNDLRRAEAFYQDFFAMDLLGRMKRGAEGTLVPMTRDFRWDDALRTGDLPDVTFLANGPLVLAVQNVGLGVVLQQGPLEMVSLGVDARTFATLKGEVLMRPLTVLRAGVASFAFRDPLGVNWEIAVVGSIPLVPV